VVLEVPARIRRNMAYPGETRRITVTSVEEKLGKKRQAEAKANVRNRAVRYLFQTGWEIC